MKRTFLFFLPLIVLLALSGCNTGSGETEGADSENSASALVSDEAAKEADTAVKEEYEYIVSGGIVHIKKYLGNAAVVVIPDIIEGCPVKSVDWNFLEGSGVEEITYPGGMTEFKGLNRCENLKTLHLPASIEKMQDSLHFCENLTEIDIEEGGAYKTAEGVLYTSDMKTLVSFPCGRTGSFTVPEGVESIGKNAFDNSRLSEIVLPDSVKTVEDYAFANTEALKEAVVPASVSSIGVSAFGKSGLKKITLSEGLEEIMSCAFYETSIKELYIPDSVIKCGYNIADRNVRISVPCLSEGLKQLLKYKNVDFRDKTRLEEAFRKAEEIVKKFDDIWIYHWIYNGVIFTDITGDNFPEIIILSGSAKIEIYFYSQKGEWQGLYSGVTDMGYTNSDLKLSLIYDAENGTYSYYTGIYNARYRSGGGIMLNEDMDWQLKVTFTENGIEYTDLFDDETIDLSYEEIIETIDISGIINSIASEYGIDIEDRYKKFTVIADRFAEEPDGKIFEKALTLNGTAIEALPYFESAYPEGMELTAAGKDILRGEEVGGVYFKHGMLTFDNAVIDAGGEEYVITVSENFKALDIKLIGENRIVSEKPCSLLNIGGVTVTFLGEGSLEAPCINAHRVCLQDGVRLRENKELVSGAQGLNADYLELWGNSRLEYEKIAVNNIHLGGNGYLKIKSLICDSMWISGSSTAEIVNDIPDAFGFSGCAVRGVKSISITDNARLYADNCAKNYDTLFFYGNQPRLTVSESGRLEINGNDLGAGISMLGSNKGTVKVYDWGSIVINGSKSCIEAPAVVIGGGSMELNACDGGQVIKTADKDEDFESGYFVSGEVLSESPEGWEMVEENGIGVMCCEGKTVTGYSVSVKEFAVIQ